MTAPPIRATYSLVDHHGTPVTEGSYAGRWQLVQFGFTACKVVCPRALAKLDAALDALDRTSGPAPLVPLYVSVDPERDTPAVLAAFLGASHPRFTGLTGTPEQVDGATRSFRVFARRRDTPDGYEVPHTAITYLLDAAGRPALHWPDHAVAETIADDLRRLLAG